MKNKNIGKGLSDVLLKTVSSLIYKPKVSSGYKHNFVRSELLPSNKYIYEMVNEAYDKKAKKEIDSFDLVAETNTLKFYKKNNVIVVSVRGTANVSDLLADLSSIVKMVDKSNRYKQDENDIKEFQKNYPQSEYIYFFVGHSLAGMLIDLFLKNKLGEAGFSYNPAILDYSNDNHYRIYSSSDEILYKLFSAKDASNVEVRKTPKKGFLQTLASFTLGNLPTSLKLHLLNTDSIKGGRIMFS
jgi:hypothetical protein